jgi:hypothetical protein
VGKHPRSAPGAHRRVAVRDELVAAGVGGGLLPPFGGQSCWHRCAEHSEPSRLDAALELLAQVRSQVGFASLEPNLEVGGELLVASCQGASLAVRAQPGSAVPGRGSSARRRLVGASSLHR